MRVLNVNDVGFQTPAGALYMVYQLPEEALAALRPNRKGGSGWIPQLHR